MKLNEKEVQTCLEYSIKPLLKKYSVYIKESQLSIEEDHIRIKAVIIYQDHVFDINTSFQIGYQQKHICFYNIEGKVEYLFLQLNLINVLQQILTDEHVQFKNNACFYECDLPIQEVNIENGELNVIML